MARSYCHVRMSGYTYPRRPKRLRPTPTISLIIHHSDHPPSRHLLPLPSPAGVGRGVLNRGEAVLHRWGLGSEVARFGEELVGAANKHKRRNIDQTQLNIGDW